MAGESQTSLISAMRLQSPATVRLLRQSPNPRLLAPGDHQRIHFGLWATPRGDLRELVAILRRLKGLEGALQFNNFRD
jgi:hypothetical protein